MSDTAASIELKFWVLDWWSISLVEGWFGAVHFGFETRNLKKTNKIESVSEIPTLRSKGTEFNTQWVQKFFF